MHVRLSCKFKAAMLPIVFHSFCGHVMSLVASVILWLVCNKGVIEVMSFFRDVILLMKVELAI